MSWSGDDDGGRYDRWEEERQRNEDYERQQSIEKAWQDQERREEEERADAIRRDEERHREALFDLENREERQRKALYDFEGTLDSLDSAPNARRSDLTDFTQFSIPTGLAKFKCTIIPFLLTTRANLDCLTGRVLSVKENMRTIVRQERTVKFMEQRLWLKLKDGREEFFEFHNFGLQAREGHSVTVLRGRSGRRVHNVAVYIHELETCFYNQESWKNLLFGIHTLLGRMTVYAIYFMVGPAAKLWFFLAPLALSVFGKGPLAALTVASAVGLAVPAALWLLINRIIYTQFKAHVLKVFGISKST